MEPTAILQRLNARTGYDIWSWDAQRQAFYTQPLCPHVVRLIEQRGHAASAERTQQTFADGTLSWQLPFSAAKTLVSTPMQRHR